MQIEVNNTDGSYTHVVLSGKMDVGGVNEIEREFISSITSHKVNALVDISSVTFMGSMALRLFLSVAKSLSWEKKKLILLKPQPMVSEVLEASSFSEVVDIENDEKTAYTKAKA